MTRKSRFGGVAFCGAAVSIWASVCLGQATQPTSQATCQSNEPKATSQPAKQEPIASKAFGVRVESDPPSYVKTLDQFGMADMKWMQFGLEHRTRWEYRDDDYRRATLKEDNQFLMRSRTYLGIKDIADPFRFGLEFQDSRQFNSDYAESTRDVDEADFLQGFGELFFKDALGTNQPIRFQAGRMSFDYVDRRLVGRNRWRNTTNAFDGFRLQLGQSQSDWQFDVFAAQPVEIRQTRLDRTDEERWLYGIVGAWRKWAKIATFEPYYFILDEDRKNPASNDREIHTLGMHIFGPIADTTLDYDVDGAYQFGDDGQRRQRAFALFGEIGNTFKHVWKPRLSFSGMYASGDQHPRDALSERFDRLFEVAHCYSMQDYFTWQNVISPRIRLEFKPLDKLRMDTSYANYWLASGQDAWVSTGRRDPTGRAGDWVGHEWDIRMRYQLDPRAEIEIGYSHFMPGSFVRNTGSADDSDFFYIQTTLQL